MKWFGFLKLNSIVAMSAVAALYAQMAHAQQGPSQLNISGGLFNSAGQPITSSNVRFKIDIYDKNGTCLMYTEQHTGVDLSASRGAFSLIIGAGTSAVNNLEGTTAFDSKIFENPGVVAPFTGCGSGLTLNPGDTRLIRVSYDIGSGLVAMTPDIPITSSAYAMVAETLQGKSATDFIMTNVNTSLSQANVDYIFSNTNYPNLKALVDGTSTQYIVSNPSAAVGFNGQRLINVGTPTGGTDATNKTYVDSNLGGKTVDVTGVGPGIGGGRTIVWDQTQNKWVTSATGSVGLVAAGTGLNGGNITASGTLSVDVGTTANKILQLDASARIPAVDGSLLTNVNAMFLQGRSISIAAPAAQQVLGWNSTTSQWEPETPNGGTVTGLTGDVTGSGTGVISTTIQPNAVTSAKINNTGVAVNRLLITDATTGATVGYASCAVGEVMQWTATGWACKSVSLMLGTSGVTAGTYGNSTQVSQVTVDAQGRVTALTNVNIAFPVISVAGRTGAVTLTATDVGGLGTAATQNVGTGVNNVLQFSTAGQLPALDGSLLTNISANATSLQGTAVSAVAPTAGQVLAFNSLSSKWEATTGAAGSVTSIATGNGLKGGTITSTGTLSVDTGTTANKILQLDASARIPAVDGSLLTNLSVTSSQWTSSGANIYYNLGDVGIGTAAPSRPMTIAENAGGGILVQGVTGLHNGNADVELYTASQNGQWDVGSRNSDGNFNVSDSLNGKVPLLIEPNTPNNTFFMKSTGNVGIGTSTPNYKLDVAGSVNASAILINGVPVGTGSGSVSDISAGTGLTGGNITTAGTLNVDVGTTANKILQLDASARIPAVDGSLLTNLPVTSSQWTTNGSNIYYNTGSVGIGTASPSAPLDVVGSMYVEGTSGSLLGAMHLLNSSAPAANRGTAMTFEGGSTVGMTSFQSVWEDATGNNAAELFFTRGAGTLAERMRITSSGNVGIGTGSPNYKLDVAGTVNASALMINGVAIGTSSSPWQMNGSNTYYSAGNVGIGTTTPSAALDVTGAIDLRGTNAINYPSNDSLGTGASIAIGPNALSAQAALAAGSYANTAVGYQVLSNAGLTTAATGNTGLGYQALAGNTAGAANTAIGYQSMLGNTTGISNTAVGNYAMAGNTTGTYNTAVGHNAMASEQSGTWNTAFGHHSLTTVVAGSFNTGYGTRSLFNTTGSSNTAVGSDSGFDVTTGQYNIFLGEWDPAVEGTGVTSGSNNILVGHNVVPMSQTASNQLNIGNLIYATGLSSGTTVATGNVGIGTLTPNYTLDVAGSVNASSVLVNGVPVGTGSGSVSNVSAGTGLTGGNITTAGTLNVDVGTTANKILQLDASARIPAVDGSLLTNVNAIQLQGKAVSSTAPTASQVLAFNALSSKWEATTPALSVTSIATGTGLNGGPITSTGTLSVDVGTTANKILQLDASARIPAVDGSLLTNLPVTSSQWTTLGSNIYYSTGNVGVGTSTPNAKLVAQGAPNASGAVGLLYDTTATGANTTFGGLEFASPAGSNFLIGKNSSNANGFFELQTEGGARELSVDNGGHWLIGNIGSMTPSSSYGFWVQANLIRLSAGQNGASSISNALQIDNSSGAGANPGFGTGLLFAGEDSGSTGRAMGQIASVWTNATDGSQSAALTFSTVDNSAAPAERLRIDHNGNVGVGTATPNYKLDVAGTVNASALMINGVAVGTSSSPWQVNGSTAYYNSGSVAIGTTSPIGTYGLTIKRSGMGLMIEDDSGVNQHGLDVTGYYGGIGVYSNSWGRPGRVYFGDAIGSDLGQIGFSGSTMDFSSNPAGPALDLTFGTNAVERMRVSGTTGFIGIGTTTPAGTLDVEGGTAASGDGSNINFYAQNGQASGTTNGGSIFLMPGTSNGGGMPGGVGIGTTNINWNMLAVGGSISASGQISTANNNGTPYATTSSSRMYPDAGASLNSNISIGNYAAVDSSGSYLTMAATNGSSLGQTAYLGAVSVTGAANYTPAIVIGQQTGATAYAERMRIDQNGNVGIGTATPGYKLDVAGTVNASALMINGVAVGTSSSPWQLNGTTAYYNGGTVGIGTTSPGADLDIESTNASAFKAYTNANNGTAIYGFESASGGIGVSAAATGTSGSALYTQSTGPGGFAIYSAGGTNYFAGNVGVGTTTPGAAVDIQRTTNSTSGMQNLENVYLTVAPSASSSATSTGARIITIVPGTSGNGNYGTLTGVDATAEYDGSAGTPTVSAINGGNFTAFNGGGMATQMNGINVGAIASGGSISANASSLTGANITVENDNPATITNVYGINILESSSGGVATNRYGLYIDASPVGTVTNDFGIYQKVASQQNYFAGNVGIGTASPNYKLDVAGTVNASALMINGVAVGTSSSQWTTSGANIYYNTGSVGIGTSSPTNAMSVVGNTDAYRFYSTAGTPQPASSPAFTFSVDQNSGMFSSGWGTLSFGTASTERIRIDSSGNVGIGTTSPTDPLTVASNVNGSMSASLQTPGTQTLQAVDFNLVTQSNGVTLGNAGNKGWDIGARGNAYTSAAQQNDLEVSYWNGSSWLTPLWVDSVTGSVGVGGTTSPQAILDVGTTTSGLSAIIVPRDTTARRPPTGVNGMIRYNTNTNKFEAFQSGAWTNMVGGSTTFPLLASPVGSPTAPAYSFSGHTNTGIYYDTANLDLAFTYAGTEMAFIDNTGIYTQGTLWTTYPSAGIYTSTGASDTPMPGPPSPGVMIANNDAGADGEAAFVNFQVNNSSGKTQNGYIAAVSNTGSSNYSPSLVFGRQTAVSNYAESMRIDKNGHVGIGTTTPSYPLDVAGDFRATGIHYIGSNGGYIGDTASNGEIALVPNNGIIQTGWGHNFQVLNSGGTVGVNISGSGASYFNVGSVGIGTTTPGYTLDVTGTMRVSGQAYTNTGNGSFTILSDARFKNVHGPYNRGLDDVIKINPILYNYLPSNPLGSDPTHEYVGTTAQDLQKAIPEAVKEKDGYLTVNTSPILWGMVNAIKELYAKLIDQGRDIASLKADKADRAEIEDLKARNQKLEQDNAAMKAYLCAKDPAASICK